MAASTTASINDEGVESVLGRGTRVRGRVRGDVHLRVEGAVEGDVNIAGDLTIDEGATIQGDVQAGSVSIGGELKGDVAARGPVTVRATAKVSGNLGGTEVALEEGASYEGRIEAEFDLPAELMR
ncbi:MAG: polymer-forming cytoskeletal protein [Polyangiaceae bacterium]